MIDYLQNPTAVNCRDGKITDSCVFRKMALPFDGSIGDPKGISELAAAVETKDDRSFKAFFKKAFAFLWMLLPLMAFAGNWVDTLYTIHDTTVVYGIARNVAGVQKTLEMDISYPTNDTAPLYGRPVMLLIHGGAFLAGSKEDPNMVQMRKDFAKRGYVTASINYRLGMFQLTSWWHCNITYIPGVEWDCLNQQDTLEWSRAYYRGIQDARGAIRYLTLHQADYQLSPNNIFVVVESAGALIAMGVGYLDVPSEKPIGTTAIPNAGPPHVNYEGQCIQNYGIATSISAMDLSRPNLGTIYGTLNLNAPKFCIRGVGDFYGGMLGNLFVVRDTHPIPALYMYHQPNDLIVPFDFNTILRGYDVCTFSAFNCGGIFNLPYCHGGRSIRGLIDTMAANGQAVPAYLAEFTNNTADCVQQILNPSVGGHQIDDYWLRTVNMATFFASKIDTICVGLRDRNIDRIQIYPNPSQGSFRVTAIASIENLEIHDAYGRLVFKRETSGKTIDLNLPDNLARGVYFVRIYTANATTLKRIMLQ